MYRILMVRSKRDNYESLFQYLTTTIDGVVSPLEIATREELDKKIEKMLNEDGYAKTDFIVIEEVDYTVSADIVEEEITNEGEKVLVAGE